MSSFAERLVARGAGRPSGLPLLTPRPAARFEREAIAPVDAELPAAPSGEAPQEAAHEPQESESMRISGEAQTKPGKPAERDAGAGIRKMGPSASPPQPSPSAQPVAQAPSPAPPAPEASRRTKGAIAEPAAHQEKPAEDETPEPPPPLFFVEPRAPIVRAPPQIEQAPPPTISIGRIDVQFLPQERPVTPSRPEPQRTRGFEAYARARRGLPR